MRERHNRLSVIKELIKNNRIDNQDTLLEMLKKEGFSVTQATLSRDLKMLKVGKISDGWSGYYYSLPENDFVSESEKSYIQDVRRGIISIEFSGDIGVIKTRPGHANSVCFALDVLALPEILGSIAGYFGGWTDIVMERLTEILGGMPFIVVMTLIALLLGSNFGTFLLALCLTGWIGVSGTTRTQFYRFKRREYVLASRTLGASDTRLIFRHILPNGIGTIVTGAVLMIPSVIFSEANIAYILPSAISFSGQQSFGITLSNAQSVINTQPYLIISASIVMAIIMICFNLFGNGLRDAFNPVLKGSNE